MSKNQEEEELNEKMDDFAILAVGILFAVVIIGFELFTGGGDGWFSC